MRPGVTRQVPGARLPGVVPLGGSVLRQASPWLGTDISFHLCSRVSGRSRGSPTSRTDKCLDSRLSLAHPAAPGPLAPCNSQLSRPSLKEARGSSKAGLSSAWSPFVEQVPRSGKSLGLAATMDGVLCGSGQDPSPLWACLAVSHLVAGLCSPGAGGWRRAL